MKHSPNTVIHRSNVLINLLYLAMFGFIVCIIVVLSMNLGNGRGFNNVFGSFDSTGAAIILVGVPYLCLQIIKYRHDYFH